jgi:hypothetical protein
MLFPIQNEAAPSIPMNITAQPLRFINIFISGIDAEESSGGVGGNGWSVLALYCSEA